MHDRDPEDLKNAELRDTGQPDIRPTGLELIIEERERQITKEGWTAEHDDEHTDGELAKAAICYATPEPIYQKIINYPNEVRFVDVWPDWWDSEWDKRKVNEMTDVLIPNSKLPKNQRIRNLVKAGALIAAEIDRLQRIKQSNAKK